MAAQVAKAKRIDPLDRIGARDGALCGAAGEFHAVANPVQKRTRPHAPAPR